MKIISIVSFFFFVLGFVTGLWAQTNNIPEQLVSFIPPQSKVKSVEAYPSGKTEEGKSLTLYVVHFYDDQQGSIEFFLVDSASKLIWSRTDMIQLGDRWGGRTNLPEPAIVGIVRKDLPPVFGYRWDWANAADFTAYKLFMWDGKEPRLVFDGFSGINGETPSFVDPQGTGTNEIIFDNKGEMYKRPPYVFKWNEQKRKFGLQGNINPRELPTWGWAYQQNEIKESLIRTLTVIAKDFHDRNFIWPKDELELEKWNEAHPEYRHTFYDWKNCADLIFTPLPDGTVEGKFTFLAEDMAPEKIQFNPATQSLRVIRTPPELN